MSPDKSVADRLLEEARAKTARAESPTLGKVALAVGILALVVSPVSILGWVFGATAVGLGVSAARRPLAVRRARIATALGAAAILVGVFFFTLNLALS
jgi:predicted transporter